MGVDPRIELESLRKAYKYAIETDSEVTVNTCIGIAVFNPVKTDNGVKCMVELLDD